MSKTESEKRSLGYETLDYEMEIESLEVEGSIPDWVEGSLYRNGPAKYETSGQELNHWFDGYAMLHLFNINDGSVRYKNKFLQSQAYESASNGKMEYREFGTDPCRDIFERFFTYFKPPDPTDNANINITKIADEYVAMTETPMPIEFDPDTLETLGVKKYDNVSGQITTAHPHYDDKEEATVNYVTEFSWNSQYKIFQIPDSTGDDELIGEIEVDRTAYMHSFGMSENYVILTEFPLVLNPWKIVFGNNPLIHAFEWKPEKGTVFSVIDKETGELVNRARTDDSFFAFHHVNAFERGDELVVDLVTYDDSSVIEEFYLDNIASDDFAPPTADLTRHTVFMDEGTIQSDLITDEPIELPRINYGSYNTSDYRYAYGVGQRNSKLPDQLVKIDVESGQSEQWYEEDTFAGEPVFVEAPDASSEDDGVLLSVMLDAANEQSFLLVLDASTFEEQARAEVPHVIPHGFHGQFYSN